MVLTNNYSKNSHRTTKSNREQALKADVDADDIIDLGAPRFSRLDRARIINAPPKPQRRRYVPNPRLYPGQPAKSQISQRRTEARAKGSSRPPKRHRKRVLNRPVPNSRLYRPAPPRPPPPPVKPRTSWPPPPAHPLDTASRAALQLGERRLAAARIFRSPLPPVSTPPAPEPLPPPSRRLVVTLPVTAAGGDSPEPECYQPHSEHFRARSSPQRVGRASSSSPPPAARAFARRAMDAANRQSASPEDCSEGNETLSAPSEFLAEFLSAIMRRQYAEALKYCRLILQYEPHNATARGFYPLLQHKLLQHATPTGQDQHSSSEEASAHSDEADGSPPHQEEMEQTGDSEGEDDGSGGSVASQSSLELDSEPSLEISRRTDSGSASGSAPCWESTGSASRSDADDNGNAPLPSSLRLSDGDLENDNAAAASGEPHHSAHLKSDSVSSLRRLRAQFACSIK